MNMLIEELQSLSSNPGSWIVVALMAAIAVISLAHFFICPIARGKYTPKDDEVSKARASDFNPGWRFGLMMMTGAGLTVAGLFMIASGIKPAIALAALVGGLLLIQTEPLRLQIREGQRMVIAAHGGAAEALEGARDRLRAGHLGLAGTNFVLLAGLIAGLLAFR